MMAQPFTRGIFVLAGILFFITGCATKGFVREEVQKSEGRVGDQLTQQQQALGKIEKEAGDDREKIGQASARIDGMGVQVRILEGTIAETKETAASAKGTAEQAKGAAEQAKGTADQAVTRAQDVDNRLSRLWSNRYRRTLTETVSIYFGFDKANLDDRAETALLDLVKQMQENLALIVELEGYTDSTGSREYNLALSQRRVDSVRRFIAEKGVDLSRMHFIGLGVAKDGNGSADSRAKNRRVTVKLFSPQE